MSEDNPPMVTPIKVRISTRAKRACLKVSVAGTVEVVVPRGFKQSLVEDFIAQHRPWLDKTLARMKLNRDPSLDTHCPVRIQLQAVNEIWQVNYGFRNKCGVAEYRNPAGQAQLWVWTPDASREVAGLLQKWLSAKAKSALTPWLKQVSAETGLQCHKISVRAQKTRWGSCSSQKHINLNRALLFLPAELVRYLMIHELSHTVHMNHSRAFWALVARWEPHYKKYESQLNQYSSQIPLWALP
jgi:predicted metal-dependent hydrolase